MELSRLCSQTEVVTNKYKVYELSVGGAVRLTVKENGKEYEAKLHNITFTHFVKPYATPK